MADAIQQVLQIQRLQIVIDRRRLRPVGLGALVLPWRIERELSKDARQLAAREMIVGGVEIDHGLAVAADCVMRLLRLEVAGLIAIEAIEYGCVLDAASCVS